MNLFQMLCFGFFVCCVLFAITIVAILLFNKNPITLNEAIAKKRSLSKVYNQLTEQERNGSVGRNVAKSIQYLKGIINSYQNA